MIKMEGSKLQDSNKEKGEKRIMDYTNTITEVAPPQQTA